MGVQQLADVGYACPTASQRQAPLQIQLPANPGGSERRWPKCLDSFTQAGHLHEVQSLLSVWPGAWALESFREMGHFCNCLSNEEPGDKTWVTGCLTPQRQVKLGVVFFLNFLITGRRLEKGLVHLWACLLELS